MVRVVGRLKTYLEIYEIPYNDLYVIPLKARHKKIRITWCGMITVKQMMWHCT